MQNPFRDFDLSRTEKRAAAERIAAARGIKLPSAYAAIRRLTKSSRTTIDRRSKDIAREVKTVVQKERTVKVPGVRTGYLFYWVGYDADEEERTIVPLTDVTFENRADAVDLAESYVSGFKRTEVEASGFMEVVRVTVKYVAPRIGRNIIEKKRGKKQERYVVNGGYRLQVDVAVEGSK